MESLSKHVVGLFESREAAERCVRELGDRGFPGEQISVAMRHGEDAVEVSGATGSQAVEAAGTGAVGGGFLGGLAGLLVGVGALTVPGVGPIVAAGPLAAAFGTALAGAGIGAAAGGLIGALVGMGVPEEHAEYYAEGVRRGGVLVTVRTGETFAGEASQIMREQGALDVERGMAAADWGGLVTPAGTAGARNRSEPSPPIGHA